MSLDDRQSPQAAERLRDAMPPLDLGGRAVAPRVEAGLEARADARPAAAHWLHTTFGRWTLRVAAALAFLALGVWYGTQAAHRVAMELTPRPGTLGALSDPAFRNRGGVGTNVGAAAVKRATDEYVAELMRLEIEKDRMTPAQRSAAEAVARAALTKALEELALKNRE